jgi:hypothetical protein
MMVRGNFLQYPVALAGTLILIIEAAATLSIAVVLVRLFVGVKSDAAPPRQRAQDSKILIFGEENKIK